MVTTTQLMSVTDHYCELKLFRRRAQ